MDNKISTFAFQSVANKAWPIYTPYFHKIIQRYQDFKFDLKEFGDIKAESFFYNDALKECPIKYPTNRIAVIDVIGVLQPYADIFSYFFGGATLDRIDTQLDQVAAMPNIDTVILYMDSPGGDWTGISETAERISLLAQTKKVITYGYGLVASGGYYLASPSSLIVCNKSSLIGSIGVITIIYDYKEAMKMVGIDEIKIRSSQSPKKHPDPTTEEGYDQIQKMLNDMGEIFYNDVAKYRDTNIETALESFGQGDVFVAEKAMNAGMIDGVSSFDELLSNLIELKMTA